MILPALPIEQLLFFLFSSLLLGSAVMVISSQNLIRSALFLVLTFFASAALWLMLQAEFLALVLILVYVGAVMTLFLFVIMTLNVNVTSSRFNRYLPGGIIIASIITGIAVYTFSKGVNGILNPVHKPANYSNTEALGSVLYTQYVYPFEIAGIILLVAIIAAIVLSFREERQRKVQNINSQISVTRAQRIRLISIPAEKANSQEPT